MSYGIQVTTGTSNNIIISDSDKQFIGFYPITIGSGSVTAQTFNSTTDLLFIKKTTNGSIAVLHFNQSSNSSQDNKIYFFAAQTTSASAARTVDYIHLRKIDTATPTGNYGIQIKNSAGNVQFDSRVQTTQNNTLFVADTHAQYSVVVSQTTFVSTTALGPLTSYYAGLIYNSSPFSSTKQFNPSFSNEYLYFNNNASIYNGVGVYHYGQIPPFFGTGSGQAAANSTAILVAELVI